MAGVYCVAGDHTRPSVCSTLSGRTTKGEEVIFETLSSITVAGLSARECRPATAPTICFLHGGGVSGWMWRPQVEALQDSYHCLIPDLPEHGKSAARRIAELIRERAHGACAHVIGLSEGAQVTVQILGCAPEVVDHAIISSALVHPLPGIGLLGPRALALIFTLFAAPFQDSDWYVRLNMRYGNAFPEQYFREVREDTRGMTAASFTHMLLENQRFRIPAGLDQVQVPALIAAGQHELPVVRQSARDLAATLPAGQGYLVAFSKRAAEEHSWNLCRPDLFNAVTRAWLTGQSLPPALIPLK
jgi:pimeloyl-ACP methyl ester carboxylesterase